MVIIGFWGNPKIVVTRYTSALTLISPDSYAAFLKKLFFALLYVFKAYITPMALKLLWGVSVFPYT